MAIKTGNINSLRVKGFARRSLFIETLPGRKKVMFYDNRYRLIQTQGNNHLNTVLADVNTSVPDFTGKPLITKVIKVAASITTTVQTTYTYDQANRLLALDQSYNGAAAMRVAAYEYNEMGQLVRKNLNSLSGTGNIPGNVTLDGSTQFPGNSLTVTAGIITLKPGFATPPGATVVLKSASYLQSLDYRYNIRGQLTNINNSTLTNDGVTNSDSNDLFGMQIMYEQQDANLGNTGYYNGMVSAVKWMSRDASGNSSNERSYVYAYDQTMQLTGSSYAERTAGSSGTFNVNQGAFNENGISYDENGNITTLARNAVQSGGSIVQVDNLQYTYDQTNNPNRLLSVTDGTGSNYTGYGFKNLTGNTSSTYQYDANGNMTSDPYKGLSTTYNILNRTDKITITTATNRYLTYTYDATGTLLRKQQFDNGTLQTTTDYSEGFVFTTAGTGSAALAYFGMPEGRIRNNGGTLKAEYIITDQQGNARISFEDNGSGKAVVRQETSYYAFGLTIPGSAVTTPSAPNKNLYNGGAEWQNDYGDLPDLQQTFYRNYDAALGRWTGVDSKAEAADNLSVYHYGRNNPIMYNDPNGDLSQAQWDFITSIANDPDNTNSYRVTDGQGGYDQLDNQGNVTAHYESTDENYNGNNSLSTEQNTAPNLLDRTPKGIIKDGEFTFVYGYGDDNGPLRPFYAFLLWEYKPESKSSPFAAYNFLQTITTTIDGVTDHQLEIDNGDNPNTPFYFWSPENVRNEQSMMTATKSAAVFLDAPETNVLHYTFNAEVSLIGLFSDGHAVSLGTYTWGYQVNNGSVTFTLPQLSNQSYYQQNIINWYNVNPNSHWNNTNSPW